MEQSLLVLLKNETKNLQEFKGPFYSLGLKKCGLIVALVLLSSMSVLAQLSQTWVIDPLIVQGQTDPIFVDQATDVNNNLLVLSFTGANTSERRVMLHKVSEDGNIIWSKIYSGEAGSISAQPSGLWVDGLGNSYVTGTNDMAGIYKRFLLKYAPDGTLVWSKSFNYSNSGLNYIRGLAIGADNHIYLSGYKTEGVKDFLFTQKMSPAGNVIWEKLHEPESKDVGGGSAITVDNKGGVFVTTDLRGYTSNYNIILIKYDATSGNQVFIKKYGNGTGPVREFTDIVTVAPAGNIYLFSYTENQNNPYHRDMFMHTLSSGGELLKSTHIGDDVEHPYDPIFYLNSVVFAPDGGLIVLSTNAKYRDVPDYFMEKYSSNGTRLWLKTFNVYEEEQNRIRQFASRSLALLDNGSIAVIGTYSYFVEPPAWYSEPTYIEKEKLMLALFNQSGQEIWRDVNQSHNEHPNFGDGISTTRGNSVYVTGSVRGTGRSLFAMKYSPVITITPEAWVSQTHSYDKAAGTITVSWKLAISAAQPAVTKYNIYHSSTENGALQNWVWDIPAGQTSVSGSYVYQVSKLGNTEFLVMGLAEGTGYVIPNTSEKPKEVKIKVEEVTGGTAPTITTGALASNKVCAGGGVAVAFTKSGTFNAGNNFIAQLSNATGSFDSPVTIGSGAASPIQATIPANTAAGTGYRIRVVASAPATTGTDNGANIIINQKPAKPGTITGTTSVCAGADNLTYTINAVAGATGYTWTVTGFDIVSGQGSNSITVKAGNTNGKLSVVSNNECGASAASEVAITVVNKPEVTITTEGSTGVCQGGSVKLIASAGSGYTYQWLKNGSAISGATGSTYSVNTTGNYAVQVTNSTGCTVTTAATEVVVNAPFTVNAGENQTVCANAAAFNLSGHSPAGGTWSGAGVTAAGSFNPATAGVGSHTLSYTVKKDNCTVTGTRIVNVSATVAKPGAIAGSSTLCGGADNITYSIAAVEGAVKYIWSVTGFEIVSGQGTQIIVVKAGSSNGSLRVIAKNNCGSSAASEKAVSVAQVPEATIVAAGATTVCDGGSVNLSVNTGNNYTYQWMKDGKQITGATATTLKATEAGNYTVTIKNGNCFKNSAPITVNISAGISSNTISNNQTVCAGQAIAALTGSAPGGGSGNYTYQWEKSTNGTDFTSISGATGKDHNPGNLTTTAWFRRKVMSGSCSHTSDATKITINPLPGVSLAVFEALCNTADAITLTGGLPAGGTYSGTGVSDGKFDPKVAGPGTHTITYSYTDGNSCGASATQTIVVKADCGVTGVEDDEPKYKLLIFPNPTRSFVNMHLNLEKRTDLTVRVVDARGRVVSETHFKAVIGEFKRTLDLKDKASGMYLLQFITGEGVKTRRVVVQ